jgi:hypothetical protein
MAEAEAPQATTSRSPGVSPAHRSPTTQSDDNHLAPPVKPDPNRRLSHEGPHGLGETEEQHAHHAAMPPKIHWGLDVPRETILFYSFTLPSWCFEIAAAVCGVYYHTWGHPFIACMTCFLVLHWAAWFQTAIGMMQRASWFRDESELVERRQYLYLAVRLNRLMLVWPPIMFYWI